MKIIFTALIHPASLLRLDDEFRNMKKVFLLVSFAIVVMVQSCSRSVYNNTAFIETAGIEGKTVAILPAEVEFTGKLPKGLSIGKKNQIEEREGAEIQNMLYREYLYRSKRARKKQHETHFMNVDQINSRLRDRGISARDSWSMNADSLGRVLGSDMVIRVRVKKDRIMSEAASLGVGVATSVLDNILSKNGSVTSLGTAGKTYNLFFDATLSDVQSGTVVTKISKDGNASWNKSPESVIRSASSKMIRRGAIYAER